MRPYYQDEGTRITDVFWFQQLSFPSTQSSHGSAGFTFSLSGNQDIEGPQGGFECIQQTGPK